MGLRFEVGPGAAVHSPLATQNGFLHFLLRGCGLELLTSVLNGLGPFLEDEEIPEVVPMKIELLNSRITLKVRGPSGFDPRPGQAGDSGKNRSYPPSLSPSAQGGMHKCFLVALALWWVLVHCCHKVLDSNDWTVQF